MAWSSCRSAAPPTCIASRRRSARTACDCGSRACATSPSCRTLGAASRAQASRRTTTRRTPQAPTRIAFHACDVDLEDELIRAVGTAGVERVLEAEGELASLRRFQDQPGQRDRDLHAQLHRFLGTRAGRKVRYGTLLVDALDLDRVPRALDLTLRHALG